MNKIQEFRFLVESGMTFQAAAEKVLNFKPGHFALVTKCSKECIEENKDEDFNDHLERVHRSKLTLVK